ncbi:hypothetical protein ACFPAF_16565 [Hymenobacter endophyticus]|uniref:Lipoprotein n=1 Tax=Hymenobacter endophyticus TaxID=3076335 RepID=A0ABU3TKX6_9BACT|nr:hypothetical protein [Hymenobacter endophyticus]MDU0372018.1 hypothetical protein [Hymenobacter endophyticus]
MSKLRKVILFAAVALVAGQSCGLGGKTREYTLDELIDMKSVQGKTRSLTGTFPYAICADFRVQWDSLAFIRPYAQAEAVQDSIGYKLPADVRKLINEQSYSDHHIVLLLFSGGELSGYTRLNASPLSFTEFPASKSVNWLSNRYCDRFTLRKELYKGTTTFHLGVKK